MLLLVVEAVAQTTHGSGASICDGATTLRAAEDGLQVGGEPRQSDESRHVSHQLGSKSCLDPFVQQPPSGAIVGTALVQTLASEAMQESDWSR